MYVCLKSKSYKICKILMRKKYWYKWFNVRILSSMTVHVLKLVKIFCFTSKPNALGTFWNLHIKINLKIYISETNTATEMKLSILSHFKSEDYSSSTSSAESSSQRQVFHRKLKNQGCSFIRDAQVRYLPVTIRIRTHLKSPGKDPRSLKSGGEVSGSG